MLHSLFAETVPQPVWDQLPNHLKKQIEMKNTGVQQKRLV
jgi:hypothetical protein